MANDNMVNDPYSRYATAISTTGSDFSEGEDPYINLADPVQTDQRDGSLEVFAKSAAGGAIESGAVFGSTLAGIKGGAAVGSIASPVGSVVGGTIGGVAGFATGMWAGGELREAAAEKGLAIDNVYDLPASQRPLAVAGETIGGALIFSGATLGVAKSGIRFAGNKVGNHVNKMLDYAKANPFKVLAAETSSNVSAGVAGGIAESVDPGDALSRFGAETIAGILNPTRMVVGLHNKAVHEGKKIYERMTPAGRKTAAARTLQAAILESGEDPILMRELLKNFDPDVTTNVAQITGSKILGAMQLQLAKHSGKFSREAKEQAESALEVLAGTIDELRRTGDPEALQQAAKLKSDMMTMLLQNQVQEAEGLALEAARKVTTDTPAARVEIGKTARRALEESLKQARKAEKELWDLVPDTDMGFDSVDEAIKELTEGKMGILRRGDIPPEVMQFMEAARTEGVTSKEMTGLRSILLEKARDATSRDESAVARINSILAEAVLDDLNTAFNGVETYDNARRFSRSLNDVYSRSFAGKAMGSGKYGDRIAPEILMRRATAGGAEAMSKNMEDLTEATDFMRVQEMSDDPAMLNTMLDSQRRILRLNADEFVVGGRVNVKGMEKFIKENEIMMNRFPEVKKVLQDAVDSEVARLGVIANANKTTKAFEATSAYADLLKEDPVVLSLKALKSNNPEKEFSNMIKVANEAGEVGRKGLRTSVLDAAMQKSTRSGRLDFEAFEKVLFGSPVTGKKSPMMILQSSGVFTQDNVKLLKKVIDSAKKIQIAQNPGTAIDEIEDGMDIIVDLAVRAGGATIASKVAGATTGQKAAGHGLIIAAGGSRAARELLEKIPNTAIKQVLMDAFGDPELMLELMSKAPTPEKQVEKVRLLHSYLLQSSSSLIRPDEEEAQ